MDRYQILNAFAMAMLILAVFFFAVILLLSDINFSIDWLSKIKDG